MHILTNLLLNPPTLECDHVHVITCSYLLGTNTRSTQLLQFDIRMRHGHDGCGVYWFNQTWLVYNEEDGDTTAVYR